jgi:hypothetical protein
MWRDCRTASLSTFTQEITGSNPVGGIPRIARRHGLSDLPPAAPPSAGSARWKRYGSGCASNVCLPATLFAAGVPLVDLLGGRPREPGRRLGGRHRERNLVLIERVPSACPAKTLRVMRARMPALRGAEPAGGNIGTAAASRESLLAPLISEPDEALDSALGRASGGHQSTTPGSVRCSSIAISSERRLPDLARRPAKAAIPVRTTAAARSPTRTTPSRTCA